MTPTTTLEWALAYGQHGWSVLPMPANGGPKAKVPLVKWKPYQTERASEEQIRAWWQQWPDANIGIVTGKISGISVLDIDEKPWEGKHGHATFLALIDRYKEWPTTLAQKTWSDGTQFIFAYSLEAGSSAGCYGPDLDGRNDGNIIVVAPSQIVKGPKRGTYQWLSDPRTTPLAPMPQWLLDQCNGTAKRELTGTKVKGAAEARSLKAGKARNNSLISLAGTMRRRGMSSEAIQAALFIENRQSTSPLDQEEVEEVAASIERYAPAEESENDPGGERFTDIANALRLEEAATGRAGHVGEMKDKWYVFDGGRLVLDFRASMYRFNREVAERLFIDANLEDAKRKELEERLAGGNLGQAASEALKKEIQQSETRSSKLRHGAEKMESRTGGDAAIEIAKSVPGLRLKLKQLDAHPTWLNTPSGTLDLDTMEMHPHRFSDLLTKMAGVAYEPAANCPRWDSFLEEVVPDVEVRAFLQRSLGLALTDITREQCLWFLYGRGRNGKTTLLNAVRHVLGDYGASTKASTLMVKQHGDDKRNDIAVLRGARFVSATETEDGQRMAEALIKEMTGEDPVTARLLYAEYFSFHPTFKIFLAANHKPLISGVDLAIWRRIHLVPFEQTIPESKVDGLLPVALQAEGSGILNWLIAGYRVYVKSGLEVPQAVRAATDAYRHESDPLADFLEDACFVEPSVDCTAKELYDAYARWAQANGVRFPLKARTLGQQLDDRGFKPHKGTGGARFWRGLRPRA
jgi:putative DNA primase/helicase